ncbi:unnamed protein product [Caenorhabditis bovis]|uniref:Roadblock/LAMTOR2 domain-containing protein n=1 Tax=Caenorhabditis bovis TaxID=2654633 RepID=A0A8S1ECB0_9PELO|nr:unnamed protein product [Caenorhabditis bovis]
MLKQKTLIEVLSQVNTSDVHGAMLFNKEGLLLAYSGYNQGKCAPNVAAALIAGIWNGLDRRDMKETILVMEDGIIAATQVATMLLAIKAANVSDIGMIRTKLKALASHLEEPISVITRESL